MIRNNQWQKFPIKRILMSLMHNFAKSLLLNRQRAGIVAKTGHDWTRERRIKMHAIDKKFSTKYY